MDGLDRLALVVYPLLMSRGGTHVVSNGEQTEPVLDALHGGETLERALESWTASWMSLPRYGSPVPSTSSAGCVPPDRDRADGDGALLGPRRQPDVGAGAALPDRGGVRRRSWPRS